MSKSTRTLARLSRRPHIGILHAQLQAADGPGSLERSCATFHEYQYSLRSATHCPTSMSERLVAAVPEPSATLQPCSYRLPSIAATVANRSLRLMLPICPTRKAFWLSGPRPPPQRSQRSPPVIANRALLRQGNGAQGCRFRLAPLASKSKSGDGGP